MIINILDCTDTEVLEIEKIESDVNLLQYVDCEPKQNEYGIFPFVVDGDTVRYKTAEELATEAAEREAAEQIAHPTIEEQLQDLSDYVDLLTEMVLGGAD